MREAWKLGIFTPRVQHPGPLGNAMPIPEKRFWRKLFPPRGLSPLSVFEPPKFRLEIPVPVCNWTRNWIVPIRIFAENLFPANGRLTAIGFWSFFVWVWVRKAFLSRAWNFEGPRDWSCPLNGSGKSFCRGPTWKWWLRNPRRLGLIFFPGEDLGGPIVKPFWNALTDWVLYEIHELLPGPDEPVEVSAKLVPDDGLRETISSPCLRRSDF